MRLYLAWPLSIQASKRRIDAREIIIDDLLELVTAGKVDGVTMVIAMLEDLVRHGRDSRFLQKLKGLPLFELKSMSRGRHKGGARVYLFFLASGDAGIVNCEVKDDDAPDTAKLQEALEVLVAYKRGRQAF
jgi:hypothetical protein